MRGGSSNSWGGNNAFPWFWSAASNFIGVFSLTTELPAKWYDWEYAAVLSEWYYYYRDLATQTWLTTGILIESVKKNLEGGGSIVVGTSAVEITFTGETASVILSASQSNTWIIYIGKSNVTNTGANALTFLMPGESLSLDYNDVTNALYAVSDTAAQSLFKGTLLW